MEITFIIEMRNMGQIESVSPCLSLCLSKRKRNKETHRLTVFCFPFHGGAWCEASLHERGGRGAWADWGFLVPRSFWRNWSWAREFTGRGQHFSPPVWTWSGFLHEHWRFHWGHPALKKNPMQPEDEAMAAWCGFSLLRAVTAAPWAAKWKYTL